MPASAVPISAKPAAGQLVEHDGKQYTTVQEGLAFILIPPEAPLLTDPNAVRDGSQQTQSVFYNPIQQFNRDLTVLAIRAFGNDYIALKEKALRDRNGGLRQKKEKRQKPKKDGQREAISQEDSEDPVKEQRSETATEVLPSGTGPCSKKRRLDADTEDLPSGTEPYSKKPRLAADNNILPGGTASTNTVQVSSTVTKLTDTGDDIDDPFEDDGIADEDFFALERSMDQGTVLPNAPIPQNHPSDSASAPSKLSDLSIAETAEAKLAVPFKILDALSATGLRSLRYAQELSFVTSVNANDLSPAAVSSIKINIQHNSLANKQKISVTTGNANSHMYSFTGRERALKYAVIDLDPYGTAVPFLDASVQALADGGLLCVTSTDTAVFNSMGYLEKAFSQYGGTPIKGEHCHEGGLRLILHAVGTAAAKHGMAMEPLLSLSIDYYARVFVRLRRSPLEVKLHAGKTMIVYNCDSGCGAWTTQPLARNQTLQDKKGRPYHKYSLAQGPSAAPLCEHCGRKTHLSGPMYGGPLHNPAFIQRILDTLPELDPKTYQTMERIKGMLSTALEETTLYPVPDSPANSQPSDPPPSAESGRFARLPEALIDPHPFYIFPSALTRVLRCTSPSIAQFRGALRHAGYRAVRSHTKPGSIKTDAPWSVLWQVMGEWVKQKSPVSEEKLSRTHAGWNILKRWAWGGSNEVEAGWEEVLQDKQEMKIIYQEGVGWKVLKKRADGSAVQSSEDSSNQEKVSKIVFDEILGNQDTQRNGLVRYQQNPRENWGPMARAKPKAK